MPYVISAHTLILILEHAVHGKGPRRYNDDLESIYTGPGPDHIQPRERDGGGT